MKKVLIVLLLFTWVAIANANGNAATASENTCVDCHQNEHAQWQQSDHAKAMALPTRETVKANFNEQFVEHFGQKARFFIKAGQYMATISYDERSDTYPIKYTFGHYPLQQYLVETENGKLQVLPFAWDARDKSVGGQRWYHNYSHEEIRPADRLHWRQPLQNWNGMCADCHSDGLERHYNNENNSFDSKFDNINVGCLSCHGDMSKHEKTARKRNVGKDVTSLTHPAGQWLRKLGEKTAKWHGKTRDNAFMDDCFACHSLRAPLNDGIKPGQPFLDQFSPQLLAAPNYHADGQIKEEVYVYGSFLQSKMYAAGVNCIDCHDKHTMKVKIADNGLCLQCHGAQEYNVAKHHRHKENSTGAQCVNCHMPDNRYMGVDDRRDHSFKIPRPDLSLSFNTPNACTQCHDDKSSEWALNNLESWHGKSKPILASKQALMLLNSGQQINLADHLHIIGDEKLDVISRATAIQLLSFTTQSLTATTLQPYLSHKEPLIRLSAAVIASLLPADERAVSLTPLLADKFKAIRVAAARNLVSSHLNPANQQVFTQAFRELVQANDISSWRGEGVINKSLLSLALNDQPSAEQSLKKAIAIEPYFATGYINLADLYRAQQKPFQVAAVLSKGIKNNPNSATLSYAYGLHFVRQKNLTQAISLFKKAMVLAPIEAQYAYTYILALDGGGKSAQALRELKALTLKYEDKNQLRELGLYLAQKLNDKAFYHWFYNLTMNQH